jgi:hypothetical protein
MKFHITARAVGVNGPDFSESAKAGQGVERLNAGIAAPSGLVTPARRGRKPAQISPLTEKGIFGLDARSDFWEALFVEDRDSRLRAGQHGPPLAGLLFSGVGVPFQNKLNDTRESSSRAAQVCAPDLVTVKG